MNENIIKVLNSIREFCVKNQSAAYYELVMNEVYGKWDKKSEEELNEILKLLEEKGIITINGDRISIRETKILLVEESDNVLDFIPNSINYTRNTIDIGHGANCLCEVLNLPAIVAIPLEILINGGALISKLRESIDVYKDWWNKIKERGYRAYFDENFLRAIVMDEIINKLNLSNDEYIRINIISSDMIKLGSLGMYAQRDGYSSESIEGAPEAIFRYVISIISEYNKFNCDEVIIRVEIDTSGNIRTMRGNKITTGSNINFEDEIFI